MHTTPENMRDKLRSKARRLIKKVFSHMTAANRHYLYGEELMKVLTAKSIEELREKVDLINRYESEVLFGSHEFILATTRDGIPVLFCAIPDEYLIELNNFLEYAIKNLPAKEAIKILDLAYKHRYSELMKELNLKPDRESGWFAYHIKTLVSAGLIMKKGERYFITETGKKAVLLIREVTSGRVGLKALETISYMSLKDELQALWAMIALIYGAFLYSINELLSIICISISIVFYAHLALKLKTHYTILLFLNVYWMLFKPQSLAKLLTITFLSILAVIFLIKHVFHLFALSFLLSIALSISMLRS